MIATDEMSKVGLGTQNLTGDPAAKLQSDNGDEDTSNTLKNVFQGGVNTFDTSPISGRGKSEIAIGEFLEKEHCRESVFLSSKCGYHWDIEDDLQRDTSQSRLKQELGESMNRMKVNVMDLYLLNAPPTGNALDSSVAALGQMQRDRNIRNIGLKNPSLEQLEQSLEITPLDFVQIPVNVFNEDHLEEFRPVCNERSVRIMGSDILETRELFGDPELPPEEEFAQDSTRMSLDEMKERLEEYFQEEYPDENTEELMASWSVHTPGVHSGVLEADRVRSVKSILRVLKFQLSEDDYDHIRRIFASI